MILIVALLMGSAWAQPADWIVENARIYTAEKGNPTTSALAIKGSRILAVGSAVKQHAAAGTQVIDAKGATIIPGFIDSHAHMANLGESLETLDLRQVGSAQEAVAAVANAAKGRAKGEWIRGRSWDQTRWHGAQFPNAAELTKVSPENPVYLTRVDGHAAWVNRKALEIADVNAATQDPSGGKIHRDSAGRPTGILIDRAMGLVSRKIPAATPAQIEKRIQRAAEECARLGITSVHDAGVGATEIAAYRTLIQAKKLPVHVYAMIGGAGPLWAHWLQRGPEVGDDLTVRSIKLYADGALGSRGAAMKSPYSDEPNNKGLLISQRAQIEAVAKQAVARGFQVNTHAIGDQGNRVVLEAYAAALGASTDRRFRVEHAQIVSLDDIPLFRKNGIIASIQATHATSDMRWAEQRVGPQRILGAYAWQRFLKAGVRIANGSDFPVEEANPLWGYYASVTRMDHAGLPRGGWMPDQILSRQEALASWTIDGAYAAFEERQKGSLTAGKLADFVMLSQDILQAPPAEILKTKVTMTVVGGRIVYRQP